ncbi:MAG: epoxyqueuosine reductase [Candidatus Aminicenantes bacterium]|nr:epoxyqueuosine reductase [Candidatus Aminicenantes bacterium]
MSKVFNNRRELKQFTEEQGFSLFGVADIIEVRKKFLIEEKTAKQFDRAVSLGKKLLDSVLDDIKDQPTPLYFHNYRQVNFFLDRGAFIVSSYIQERGYKALPIAASQILDWEKQTAHLSHKEVGRLSGLGWIGRNNLLVNPGLGSRFRLVTILTDMPLEADVPIKMECGECRDCIDVCPAGAIKEKPEDFDHIACFEKLKEFRRRHIVNQYICGVCVKACSGKTTAIIQEVG